MTNKERSQLVRTLLADYADHDNLDLAEEMILTCVGLLKDDTGRGDMKLLNKAFKEMRYALNIFSGYRHLRKVSIFGSARTLPEAPEYQHAARLSEMMADLGFMVITGAGPGIMEAANKGAGSDRSFGLNIRLPFEQSANPYIDGDSKLITFRYFFTRKLMFLKETQALICFPGGFGTMDETFESLTLIQTGKSNVMPIILVDVPGGDYWQRWDRFVREELLATGLISEGDLDLYMVTDDLNAACTEVEKFYRVFHSKRWVGDRLVIRLQSHPEPSFTDDLGHEFGDMLDGGSFEIHQGALPREDDNPELDHLPRLVFKTNSRKVGRLRKLIDRINETRDAPCVKLPCPVS